MPTSKLSVKTTNNKGGFPAYRESIGRAVLFSDDVENLIIADAFEGYDDSYKRREHTQIMIQKGNHGFTFPSFDSLFELLTKYMTAEEKTSYLVVYNEDDGGIATTEKQEFDKLKDGTAYYNKVVSEGSNDAQLCKVIKSKKVS